MLDWGLVGGIVVVLTFVPTWYDILVGWLCGSLGYGVIGGQR